MFLADTHCDTLYQMTNEGKDFGKNDLHIDLDKLSGYEGYAQFFACFSDPIFGGAAKEKCLDMIDTFYQMVQKYNGRVLACFCGKDLDRASEEKKNAAFLSIEGGEPVESLSDLRNFYRLGVRMMALTWNPANAIATGVGGDPRRGVTEFGKDVIREMNRLGMAVDVSHLNEQSFWDTAAVSRAPVIASHSNARAVCGHVRNLTDTQFHAIVQMGGYVGMNLCPLFLNDKGEADISDIVRHIEHFMALGGEHTVGIGADFDGIDTLPREIESVRDVYKLFDELAVLGYSDELLRALAFGNFRHMVKHVIG